MLHCCHLAVTWFVANALLVRAKTPSLPQYLRAGLIRPLGSLNVAGEKPMDCMACKMPIASFRLTSAIISATGAAVAVPEPVAAVAESFVDTASLLASAEINTVEMLTSLNDEPAVLRIDNVPWDVTPTMLRDWLGSEMGALCHHVLVDRRDGRTLSYAYMEVSPQAMKAILRAKQNSILGFGKRARAVTITVASQEELMRQVDNLPTSMARLY